MRQVDTNKTPLFEACPRILTVIPLILIILMFMPVSSGSQEKAEELKPVKIRTPRIQMDKSKSQTKSSSVKKIPDKVAAIVEEIQGARNLEQVRQAYEQLRFNKAEDKALTERITKDRSLIQKLKLLSRPEIQKLRSSNAGKYSRLGKRSNLLQNQQQKVGQLSVQARRAFPSLTKMRPAKLRSNASTQVKARPFLEEIIQGMIQGDIDSVAPLPATVGQPVVITGDEFGTRRGEVFFLYQPDRAAFPAAISSWSDRRIEISIPDDVAECVGESQKLFQVRVIPADADMGPVHDCLINPAPQRLEPRITRVVPDSIMPGQQLTILGSNFLTEGTGTVTFSIGGERFPLTVAGADWQDTAVIVRLPPDISGLVAQNCLVTLENHIGNTATFNLRFEPILEESALRDEWSHDCWGLLGHKETVTHHNYALANQWKVVESHLFESAMGWIHETTGTGGGCIERRTPVEGSGDPSLRFEGWCNALNIVWCNTRIDILGPRGTSPR